MYLHIGTCILTSETRTVKCEMAGNFCFLPCLSNNMRVGGHNFLTQIFLTGSCYTKNILRHVGMPSIYRVCCWMDVNVLCFESTHYFAETVSVRCKLIVLQRRRASIRLPRLAVDDFNHTGFGSPECHIYQVTV